MKLLGARRAISGLGLGLLIPCSSFAAGLQSVEQGTWDMGRAVVGAMSAGDSAATAYYNPAAMTLLDRPQALGGIMGISGETRFDSNSKTTASGGDGGNQSGNAVVPAGPFYVHPLNEEWAVGFSVTAPIVGTMEPRDTWAGRYVVTPAFNEDKDPVYEYRGTEARTIADDKGLFKLDDLRRMGKR